jgi:murein DD-endopeptidase MepM/ murein hydrolase activator NlpD
MATDQFNNLAGFNKPTSYPALTKPNQSNPVYPGIASTFSSFKKLFPTAPAKQTSNVSGYSQSGTDDVIEGTPEQYAEIIRQKAKEVGVSPSILSSLLKTESSFNPSAARVTPKESSYGMAQININAHPEVTREQAQDPAFAISFAAKRLKGMIDKYGLYEGIQAYNTPGAIGSAQLKQYADKILGQTNYGKEKTSPAIQMTPASQTTYPRLAPSNFQNLGKITTKWGEQTRYEKFHPGVDVANKKGTPIGSFVPGTVTKVITGKKHGQNGYGNQVEVTDQWGNKHRYSHLDQSFVKVGQKINKGQEIGTMGDTGSTYSPSGSGTGTHLDYRIVNSYNQYMNPYTYFKNIT